MYNMYVGGFQCAEIGVQSVQAWWLSYLTTNKSLLTTYVSCIILHCLVAPWFILSTIPFFHTTFRLFVNSIIGYIEISRHFIVILTVNFGVGLR